MILNKKRKQNPELEITVKNKLKKILNTINLMLKTKR